MPAPVMCEQGPCQSREEEEELPPSMREELKNERNKTQN